MTARREQIFAFTCCRCHQMTQLNNENLTDEYFFMGEKPNFRYAYGPEQSTL